MSILELERYILSTLGRKKKDKPMGEMADLALSEMMDADEIQQRANTWDEAVALGIEEDLFDYDGSRHRQVFSKGKPMPTKKKVPVKKAPTKRPTPKADPTPKRRPEFIVCHGVPGVGKTSFGAFAPNPLFIVDSQETGIIDLAEFNLAPKCEVIEIESTQQHPGWDQLLDEADKAALRNDIETVVFDSLTGFEKMCFQHVCKRDYDGVYGKDGFLSYYQGPRSAAKNDLPEFLEKLVDIRRCGKNVILIAHSSLKTVQNPTGADYDRWTPYLDKESWAVVYRVAETVLFMDYDIEVTKEKGGTRFKAKGGDRRYMYTEFSPSYEAKNRCGLPPFISMGSKPEDAWKNYYKAKHERKQ